MEELLIKIFSEGGLIYGLFFMIVAGFVWKGIPFIATKFEALMRSFNQTLKDQQETFKDSLAKISSDFVAQIEKSNSWHEKHSIQLDEIKELLKHKK